MGMEKTTYLIYGIVLPITRERGDDGYTRSWLGDSGHHIWEDEMLPYIEGHDGVTCRLLCGEAPANKAYFGLVLASTSGKYEDNETDVTDFMFEEYIEITTKAIDEAAWLLGGRKPDMKLMMVDIIS